MNKEAHDKQLREYWFKDHKTTLTKLSEDMSVLVWKKPGTTDYYVRYVMDGKRLYISGDLGEAVFCLTWKATPESFKDISMHYFYEKMDAYHTDKASFDKDTAKTDLEEHFGDYDEEHKYTELLEDLKSLAKECSRCDEWAYEVRDRYDDELEEFDGDYWEWIYDIGKEIPGRVRAYLVGLQMAAEQLAIEKKYYIVSNKWTKGLTRTFWGSNNSGYVMDISEAGIYTQEDVEKDAEHTPLITKENLNDRGKYDSFFIAVEDVELLGKRMTCILN